MEVKKDDFANIAYKSTEDELIVAGPIIDKFLATSNDSKFVLDNAFEKVVISDLDKIV